MKNIFQKYKKLFIIVGVVIVLIIGGLIAVSYITQPKNELLEALEDDPSNICTVYNSVDFNNQNPNMGAFKNSSDITSTNDNTDDNADTNNNAVTEEDNDGERPGNPTNGISDMYEALNNICSDNTVSDSELTQLEELKNSDSITQLRDMEQGRKLSFWDRIKSIFGGSTGPGGNRGGMGGGTPPTDGDSRPDGFDGGEIPNGNFQPPSPR